MAFAQSLKQAVGTRRALDLGSRVGRHALFLAELGFEIAAIDASTAGLTELEKGAARRGLSIEARHGLMTDLPYADGHFDDVLSFNVIYHGDPMIVRKAIAEITRVLKPGGHFQGTMLAKRNSNFGKGREIAPDTFVKEDVTNKAHPHYDCNAAELVTLFGSFELLSLEDKVHSRPGSWHWHMIAERTT